MIEGRLATLVHARVASSAKALTAAEIAKALQRFAPATYSESAWRDAVESVEPTVDKTLAICARCYTPPPHGPAIDREGLSSYIGQLRAAAPRLLQG